VATVIASALGTRTGCKVFREYIFVRKNLVRKKPCSKKPRSKKTLLEIFEKTFFLMFTKKLSRINRIFKGKKLVRFGKQLGLIF
jgi:hypothetical protein